MNIKHQKRIIGSKLNGMIVARLYDIWCIDNPTRYTPDEMEEKRELIEKIDGYLIADAVAHDGISDLCSSNERINRFFSDCATQIRETLG